MKTLIKKIMPTVLILLVRRIRQKIEIEKLYNFDQKRLKKYAYSINNNYSEENLRSKITFHYHAIEKGLSNSNLRLGFGKRAFKELFWAMDEYINRGYPTNDYRFQSAISVIKSYIELHQMHSFSIQWIEDQMEKYSNYLNEDNLELGGSKIIRASELPEFGNIPFESLSKSRYSVRDFGIGELDDSKVFEAINIASKTPSVCNRQAWKVRFIKSPDKVKNTLIIQNGLTGNGENLNKLLVVTADKQYMNGGHERNQTYIDGGLFTMSLLYALTSKGIASCTLNASFDLKRESKMRQLLQVKESEDFIAVIAIGTYPDTFKVAKSPRDDYSIFTTVIE